MYRPVSHYTLVDCNNYRHKVKKNFPLIVSFPDDFSLSGGKIRLVIRLFRFGAGAPECWRIVLF